MNFHFDVEVVAYNMEGGKVSPFNLKTFLRKPSIGGFAVIERELLRKEIVADWNNSFMVGDMDSDREAAEKGGITYYDINDFLMKKYQVTLNWDGKIFFSKDMRDFGIDYGSKISFRRNGFQDWELLVGPNCDRTVVKHSPNTVTMRTIYGNPAKKIIQECARRRTVKIDVDFVENEGNTIVLKLKIKECIV